MHPGNTHIHILCTFSNPPFPFLLPSLIKFHSPFSLSDRNPYSSMITPSPIPTFHIPFHPIIYTCIPHNCPSTPWFPSFGGIIVVHLGTEHDEIDSCCVSGAWRGEISVCQMGAVRAGLERDDGWEIGSRRRGGSEKVGETVEEGKWWLVRG